MTFWKKMRLKAFADFCASVTFNLFEIRTWMIFFFLVFSSLVDLSFVIGGLFTSCLSQLLPSFPVIVKSLTPGWFLMGKKKKKKPVYFFSKKRELFMGSN